MLFLQDIYAAKTIVKKIECFTLMEDMMNEVYSEVNG